MPTFEELKNEVNTLFSKSSLKNITTYEQHKRIISSNGDIQQFFYKDKLIVTFFLPNTIGVYKKHNDKKCKIVADVYKDIIYNYKRIQESNKYIKKR